MNNYLSLPQGVKDFGPHRAEELKRVEDSLLEEFSRWGYKRVITPLFEYLDTITVGLGDELRTKVMKFVDPSTGDIVALRPDITPQIGRIVATQLKDVKVPLRLCYSGRVVRFEEKGSGKEREVFQAGCELVGLDSPEADAETIALAVKSLEKQGLKNLVLDIGHTGILRVIFDKVGDISDDLKSALRKKDFEHILKSLKGSRVDESTRDLLFRVFDSFGSTSSLEMISEYEEFREYVDEIYKVLEILDEYRLNCDLSIDIGDIRGFNYYTGLTFEVITPDAPNPLLIGGRYNGLVEKYGHSSPATGFAIDMESVLSVTKTHHEDNQVHFIIVPKKPGLRREAIRLTQWLRSSGFKVILDLNKSFDVDFEKGDLNKSLTSYGVILLETSNKLKLIESRSGVSREFSNLEDLLKGGI